ncbi:MAG: FadR family transcriptional regulator [Peptococcaceae bacterium]|nr:FadR family transcriptional regulator [Peptococcaceae bacterium]
MDFKPIKTKKIYEEIIEQVKVLIAEGALSPGDRLISERELADKLQVGRSAVREAFRALEAMGIIEIRPGEGTFIREANTLPFMEVLAHLLVTEQNSVRELLELRKILEVESAGLAALRHTAEEIEKMERHLEQMRLDILNGELGEQADMNFHYAIAEATHNSLLLKLMNAIADTMRTGLRQAREKLYRTPGTPERLLREHIEICHQIKKSNVEGARRAMLEHLEKVEKGLQK